MADPPAEGRSIENAPGPPTRTAILPVPARRPFMHDGAHLFQAFVSPAIFFPATALLILCINTRLMGIVSRLLLSCLLLGLGLYWNVAPESAAIVFVLSMISLLVCAAFFFREVTLALRSVQDEAHDLRD